MTKVVNCNSKNTMRDDVVCISDDDEQEEQNESLASATERMRNMAFNYNVYENNYTVPESARRVLEMFQKQKEQQVMPQMQASEIFKEPVVYVPDDVEEEILLIGPIRKFSRQILFGDKLTESPAGFPYSVLLEFEKHLTNSLRNVSLSTEANVWDYTMDQLSCFRLHYSGIYDVSHFHPLFRQLRLR